MSILEDSEDITSELTPPFIRNLKRQVHHKEAIRDEQIDKLETEILILRRSIPRLENAQGKDVTNQFILLTQSLEQKDSQIELLKYQLEEKQRDHLNEKTQIQKEYSTKIDEYTKKLQSFREEYENSIVSEAVVGAAGDSGRATLEMNLEQAKKLLAAEYDAQIEKLVAEMNALRSDVDRITAENEALHSENDNLTAQIEDLEEQEITEVDYQQQIDAMKAEYEEEVKKRNKAIKAMNKLIPDGLIDAMNGIHLKGKELLVQRLKADLKLLNRNWEQIELLQNEIQKLIEEPCYPGDTISQFQLAQQRMDLEEQLSGSSSSSSLTLSSQSDIRNTSAKEVHEAVIHISIIKRILEPLIAELKRIPKFFEENLPGLGLSENEQFLRILRQISDFTIDLDATFQDVTGVLGDLEELEGSIIPNLLDTPKVFHERVTDEALRKEVYNLRTTLNDEIALKERFMNERDDALEEVQNHLKRIQEFVHEKMTLQRDMQELEDDFNVLKEKYENDSNNAFAEDYEKVRKHLKEARDSLAAKNDELRNFQNQRIAYQKALMEAEQKCNDAETFAKQKIDEMDEVIEHYQKLESEMDARTSELKEADQKLKMVYSEHQKCAGLINSLKQEKAALKKADKNSANVCDEEDCQHEAYLYALLVKISNYDDPNPIECPSILPEPAHKAFMDLIENSSPQVVERFDYAYKKLENIKNYRDNSVLSDASNISNVSLTNCLATTMEITAVEFTRCRDTANEIIQELKGVIEKKKTLNLKSLIGKIRQLRNFLHLAGKYFASKKVKIDEGKNLTEFIEELDKIHDVLDDAKVASKVLKPEQINAKGKRYF